MASVSNKTTKPILESESSLSTRQSIEIPDFVESVKHHQEHGLQFMIPSTPCSDHPMMFEITVEAELRCTMTILNQSRDKKLVVKKLELILQDDPVNFVKKSIVVILTIFNDTGFKEEFQEDWIECNVKKYAMLVNRGG